jgi:hypothetical protein
MTGSAEEKTRREEILAALLEVFERGGKDAASDVLQAKMSELEGHIDDRLATLEEKL